MFHKYVFQSFNNFFKLLLLFITGQILFPTTDYFVYILEKSWLGCESEFVFSLMVVNRQKTEEITGTMIVGMRFKNIYTCSFILASVESTGTHAVVFFPNRPATWTNTDREVIFF